MQHRVNTYITVTASQNYEELSRIIWQVQH